MWARALSRCKDRIRPLRCNRASCTSAKAVMDSIRLEENGLAFPESCMVDRRRIRIVAFSREVPDPTRSSGDRRFSTMLRLLARRCDVHLCVSRARAEVDERGAAAEFVQCGIRVYIGRQRMALLAARKFDV